MVLVVEPESTATTRGRLIGAPELLLELELLELLEELELLDELELLLELLLDELDELEDEPVSTGPPPPQAVSKEAHSKSARGGVEIAGFKGIRIIRAPEAIFFVIHFATCIAIPQRTSTGREPA